MLVFISDLHFVDETAGKHNIPASAFEKFLTSIERHAQKAKAKELKIVFLGDIFDILRTEAWFKEKEEDRPWGNNTAKMRSRAANILNEIQKKNKDTFDLFAPEALKARFTDIPVETVYIPGNHDRLCWLIPDLKAKVIQLLGLSNSGDQSFSHHFMDTDHGVYATHGHCFDKYNYEGGPARSEADYKLVPLGDPITTELIAKLPYILMRKVKKMGGWTEKDLDSLKRNFQEIENVRPFSATLNWLLYQVRSYKDLENTIEEAVDKTIKDFKKLKFVKQWYDRHDIWYKPLDDADKIQGLLFLIDKFKIFSARSFMGLMEKLKDIRSDEKYVDAAQDLLKTLDRKIQYVVLGHTHNPMQNALGWSSKNNVISEKMYLNTGTWRKRYHECRDKSGFIGWKNMCYVILYKPKEKPNLNQLPVFETWAGTEKREEEAS